MEERERDRKMERERDRKREGWKERGIERERDRKREGDGGVVQEKKKSLQKSKRKREGASDMKK